MEEELTNLLPELKNTITQGLIYGQDLYFRAIKYYLIGNIIVFILSLIGVFIVYKLYKNYKKNSEDMSVDVEVFHFCGGFMVGLFSIIFLISAIFEIVQLLVVPELYLLQVII